jgi:hypothetical protein
MKKTSIFTVLLLCVCSSCKTPQYISVAAPKIEYRDNFVRDSIFSLRFYFCQGKRRYGFYGTLPVFVQRQNRKRFYFHSGYNSRSVSGGSSRTGKSPFIRLAESSSMRVHLPRSFSACEHLFRSQIEKEIAALGGVA